MACSVELGGRSKYSKENLEDWSEESLKQYRRMRLGDMTGRHRLHLYAPIVVVI